MRTVGAATWTKAYMRTSSGERAHAAGAPVVASLVHQLGLIIASWKPRLPTSAGHGRTRASAAVQGTAHQAATSLDD